MRVLGISPLDKDSTVSFMEDGRVVFACGEERLSRVKLQDGFPHRRPTGSGTDWLDTGNRSMRWPTPSSTARRRRAPDARGLASDDRRSIGSTCTAVLSGAVGRGLVERRYARGPHARHSGLRQRKPTEFMPPKSWLKRLIYEATARSPRLDWAAHRRDSASGSNGAIAERPPVDQGTPGRAGRIRPAQASSAASTTTTPTPPTPSTPRATTRRCSSPSTATGRATAAAIYTGSRDGSSCCTVSPSPTRWALLRARDQRPGLQASRHEGKIVGLAAYGNPEHLGRCCWNGSTCEDGDIRIRGGLNHFFTRALAQRFAKRDMAAAYQRVLEEVAQQAVALLGEEDRADEQWPCPAASTPTSS